MKKDCCNSQDIDANDLKKPSTPDSQYVPKGIGKTLEVLAGQLKNSVTPKLTDEFIASFRPIYSTTASDTVNQIIDIGKQITKIFSDIKVPIFPKFPEEIIAQLRYIDLLKQAKWPLYLINDEKFRADIKVAYEDNSGSNKILHIVSEFCNKQYLLKLLANWTRSSAISDSRKPILSEAIILHNKGFFIASTSILMCQLDGIASDIVSLSSRNGLVSNEKDKTLVEKRYCIKKEFIDRAKGKLIQAVLFTDRGVFIWDAFTFYLLNEILCSSKSEERWASQPLRHKICHGEQLNYGTIEHSIKAILCIDMLILLANEIERIVRIKNE